MDTVAYILGMCQTSGASKTAASLFRSKKKTNPRAPQTPKSPLVAPERTRPSGTGRACALGAAGAKASDLPQRGPAAAAAEGAAGRGRARIGKAADFSGAPRCFGGLKSALVVAIKYVVLFRDKPMAEFWEIYCKRFGRYLIRFACSPLANIIRKRSGPVE